MSKIPRVPVENQITALSVVKIAIKFFSCIIVKIQAKLRKRARTIFEKVHVNGNNIVLSVWNNKHEEPWFCENLDSVFFFNLFFGDNVLDSLLVYSESLRVSYVRRRE